MTRRTTWDAVDYDARFGYVSAHAGGALEWLGPQPGMRILDVGCGTGEVLSELLGGGADAYGIDADAAMVSRARERVGAERVRLLDAQSLRPDVVDQPFDAVFSNAALHWMIDAAAVIAAVRSVLVPEGRFVAEMGGGRNMGVILKSLRAARTLHGADPDVAMPWFFPSSAEYAALLEAGGFEIRRLAYFPRPTLLTDSANPVGDWIEMFAESMVDDLAPDVRSAVLVTSGDLARDALYRDGHWYADYWRLRFDAVAP